jgi:threonine-phosphate decarboxylase
MPEKGEALNNSRFSHGGTLLALAAAMGIEPESLLDFSASINPLGPAPGVRPAVAAAFDRVVHYPEIGSPGLCRALAAYHALGEERIVVANGSTELIHLLPRLTGKSAGRALLLAPTFSEYAHALELAGWRIDYLCLSPEDGFTLDLAQVATELAQGYDLLFFCNPGNPTGRLYPAWEVVALHDLCRRAGCFLVLDEAFMDFAEEQSAKHRLPEGDDDWLILRSMTKFFGFPGVRLGYAVASPALIVLLQQLLPPWNVGALAQAAGLAALADREHCRRTREFVDAERERLVARLGALPGLTLFPGAANYLLLQIKCGMTAATLQEKLLAGRILIRDCSNFIGLDGRFSRVAVRTGEENKRLLQALERAMEHEVGRQNV